MRDLNSLLSSLINVDRSSLIAILSSEAEVARKLLTSLPQRTGSQRAKRREVAERVSRIDRFISFFRDGKVVAGMSDVDLAACKALEQKLHPLKQ
jgi:hypothetical protein